jgi:cobalt transporter subunit CbtB
MFRGENVMRHTPPSEAAERADQSRAAVAIAAVFTALLGFFIIYGVGFSHIPAFHNAAHDLRHSFAFPCH